MAITSAQWTRLASTARLQRSSHAVSVVGSQVLIFGGELLPRQPVDNKIDVVAVDSAVQTLPTPATAPSPRVGSPSTSLDGSVWLFSGRGGLEMKPVEEQGSLWRYNAAKAEWTSVKPADSAAPYPADRSYHCIASDGERNVFVHAGCPEKGRLSDLWKFDVETRIWTELPSAPGPARGGASIAYSDGRLYRMNGFDGQEEQGGAIDVYDIAAQSWSTVTYSTDDGQGPEARSVSTLLPATVDGKVYLLTAFGEHDPSSLGHAGAGRMLSDVWAWDVQESQWQKLEIAGDVPQARGWFDGDVVKDGRGNDALVVHGGLNEANERLGDVWQLALV
ncbi:hypothetical protein NLU13_6559 [Sarocladium strictum]|uniref:Kelch repeat protein n=1 Tax=Sarocladium strictum TaxID=5046 RepID=A0AA39GHQ2_SARSR|nr:hypothetical protein NLU13_6559 [Sarocladium strictum]